MFSTNSHTLLFLFLAHIKYALGCGSKKLKKIALRKWINQQLEIFR